MSARPRYLVEELARLRVFVAASGLLVSAAVTPLYVLRRDVLRRDVLLDPLGVWFDYALWYIALCVALSAYLDLAAFSRGHSVLSTLLLDLAALLAAAVSRAASWLYAETVTSFGAPPVGGCVVDRVSLDMAAPVLVTPHLAFAAAVLHTARGRPVVLRESVDLATLVEALRRRAGALLGDRRVPLLVSFAAGFLVRLYPELAAGPLPVGWDTWEYMAMARQFAHKLNPLGCYIWLGSCRTLPPLLTVLMGAPALAVDPVAVAKLYPAAVMGLLALLSSAITLRVSGSGALSLAAGLVASLHPYVVGQSQQWFRHLLGAVALLLYLYACERRSPGWARASALVLAASSYEPSAAVAAVASAYELASARGGGGRVPFLASLAASSLLLLYYMGFPSRPAVAVTRAGIEAVGVATYGYQSVLVYTFTWLLVLAPNLVALAHCGRTSRQHRVVLAATLLAALAPLVVTPAPSDQHRWFTLFLTLSTPAACLWLGRLGRRALAAYVAVSVLAGYAYVFTPGGYEVVNVWRRTVPHAGGFPWRMVPAVGAEELRHYRELPGVLEGLGNATVLVSLRRYPALHYFMPTAQNIAIAPWEPELLLTASYMNETGRRVVVVVTGVDLVKQREEVLGAADGERYGRLVEVLRSASVTRINQVAYVVELGI